VLKERVDFRLVEPDDSPTQNSMTRLAGLVGGFLRQIKDLGDADIDEVRGTFPREAAAATCATMLPTSSDMRMTSLSAIRAAERRGP
jgi:hypothetical protein